MNIIKKYFKLIDNIITNILDDLTHFRVWLVIFAIFLNLLMMYLVAFKGVDYKAFICSFGAITIAYTFYFASKQNQSKQDHEIKIKKIEADALEEDSDDETENE